MTGSIVTGKGGVFAKRYPMKTKERIIKNKLEQQELLREKLDGEKIISQLAKCAADIESIIKSINTGSTARPTKAVREIEKHKLYKSSIKLKAINALADLNFKRLNKILPDLKSTELTSPDDETGLMHSFSTAVDGLAAAVGNVAANKVKRK